MYSGEMKTMVDAEDDWVGIGVSGNFFEYSREFPGIVGGARGIQNDIYFTTHNDTIKF